MVAASTCLGACTSAQVKETAQYTAATVLVVALEVHDHNRDKSARNRPGNNSVCGRTCRHQTESSTDRLAEALFTEIGRQKRQRQAREFDAFMNELKAAEQLSADEILLSVTPR